MNTVSVRYSGDSAILQVSKELWKKFENGEVFCNIEYMGDNLGHPEVFVDNEYSFFASKEKLDKCEEFFPCREGYKNKVNDTTLCNYASLIEYYYIEIHELSNGSFEIIME